MGRRAPSGLLQAGCVALAAWGRAVTVVATRTDKKGAVFMPAKGNNRAERRGLSVNQHRQVFADRRTRRQRSRGDARRAAMEDQRR